MTSLPPLLPGWKYQPKEKGTVLDKLRGVTQIEDLPVVLVEGDSDVYLEIVKENSGLQLSMYEHLIFRLNPGVESGRVVWPSISVFVSTHVPGKVKPQVDLAGVMRFKPPLLPESSDTPARIQAAIDSRDAQPLLKAIFDNMRLAPYFSKHVPKTPRV